MRKEWFEVKAVDGETFVVRNEIVSGRNLATYNDDEAVVYSDENGKLHRRQEGMVG